MQKSKSFGIMAIFALIAVSTVSPAMGALSASELEEALVQVRIDNARIQLEADEALQLIEYANTVGQPFSAGDVVLNVKGMHQGTNPNNASLDSSSWLEVTVQFQDGTEVFRTNDVRSTFQVFQAFDNTPLFSFQPDFDPLRTVIRVDIVPVTNYSKIGSDFCFDLSRNNLVETFTVNGQVVNADLTTSTGIMGFNQATQEYRGNGVSFVPELTERLLGFQGIELKTGDEIGWKVVGDNRFTVWKGQLNAEPDPRTGEFSCGVTGEFAFDVFAVGMLMNIDFTYVDPADAITIFNQALPDTDGDGIPDVNDQCDFSRETVNGFQDLDGCPDDGQPALNPTELDTDGDGIPDVNDLCPTQPEAVNGFEDNDGCFDIAPPDSDNDGVLDINDLCPNEKENFNGIQDGDGCADGLTTENTFTGTNEPLVNLTPDGEPIPSSLSTIEELLSKLKEDNPETPIHIDPNTDITGEAGTSNQCDNLKQNCIVVIEQAVREFEERTGINIPFPLTTLNIILFFAIISIAIVVLLKVLKKI